MGFMDKIKGKMHHMGDEMRQRYEDLKNQENDGTIDDNGRTELQQLRDRYEHRH